MRVDRSERAHRDDLPEERRAARPVARVDDAGATALGEPHVPEPHAARARPRAVHGEACFGEAREAIERDAQRDACFGSREARDDVQSLRRRAVVHARAPCGRRSVAPPRPPRIASNRAPLRGRGALRCSRARRRVFARRDRLSFVRARGAAVAPCAGPGGRRSAVARAAADGERVCRRDRGACAAAAARQRTVAGRAAAPVSFPGEPRTTRAARPRSCLPFVIPPGVLPGAPLVIWQEVLAKGGCVASLRRQHRRVALAPRGHGVDRRRACARDDEGVGRRARAAAASCARREGGGHAAARRRVDGRRWSHRVRGRARVPRWRAHPDEAVDRPRARGRVRPLHEARPRVGRRRVPRAHRLGREARRDLEPRRRHAALRAHLRRRRARARGVECVVPTAGAASSSSRSTAPRAPPS